MRTYTNDGIIQKLSSSKKRTFSTENLMSEDIKSNKKIATIKVDLNSIFKKDEESPIHKVNYFDDCVLTTDILGSRPNHELNEDIYNHEFSLEIDRNSKENFEQNHQIQGKNDFLNQKVDIQHCEINLFADNSGKNENFEIVLKKTEKDCL